MKKLFYKKQHCVFYMIILALFFLILLLNCLTPMAADDFAYSFVIDESDRLDGFKERVNSPFDIFESQWNHYFTMNGRIVGHLIAQFFLWLGKPIFNIFNSIVFIIYINLVSYLSFGKRSALGILCTFLMVWLLLPAPGSVLFWLDGACNYLWGGMFVLLFIYCYYKSVVKNNEVHHKSICFAFLWFLFGIISGWCNENTSGMGILICCLLTIYEWKTNKEIPLWKITGILGAVFGFSLMIAAPGNYNRLAYFKVPDNLLTRVYEGFVRADSHGFSLSGTDGILFFLFLFSYLFMIVLPKIKKERKIIGGIWFLGALACNYAMALSPSYPARASFGVFSMYFISILYASRTLIETFNMNVLMDIVKALLCVGCLYFSISYCIAVGDIAVTYHRNNKRVEMVLEEKSKGNYDVVVPKMHAYTKYNVFAFVSDWPNYEVVRYFGMNSIKLNG